jgi:hypothetical protein
MGAIQDKLEALEAEVARLKQSTPTVIDHAAAARFKDEMHQASEARASRFNPFTRDQLDEMRQAAPDNVCAGIVRDNQASPTVPRSVIPSSGATDVRGPLVPPGSGSGWSREVQLSNPPGVAQADRLMDAQDRRDRHEAVLQEAKRLALQKAVEKQPK